MDDDTQRITDQSEAVNWDRTAFMALRAFTKKFLYNSSWKVRVAAIQSLGRLSEELIIEPLRTSIEDQDFSVRSAALHVLGTLKGCISTDDLLSLAREETNDWITRDAAVTALERAGEYELAKDLRASLDHALEAEEDMIEEDPSTVSDLENNRISSAQPVPTVSLATEEIPSFVAWERTGRLVKQKRGEKGRTSTSPLRKINLERLDADGPKSNETDTTSSMKPPDICHDSIERQTLRGRNRAKEIFLRAKVAIVLLPVALGIMAAILGLGSLLQSHATANDDAHLKVIGQTQSVMVTPSQSFSVSIAATNVGATTWTDADGYRLDCKIDGVQGRGWMKTGGIPISSSAYRNNGTYVFVVPLTAPPTKGIHTLQWTMFHHDIPFGDILSIEVYVL